MDTPPSEKKFIEVSGGWGGGQMLMGVTENVVEMCRAKIHNTTRNVKG